MRSGSRLSAVVAGLPVLDGFLSNFITDCYLFFGRRRGGSRLRPAPDCGNVQDRRLSRYGRLDAVTDFSDSPLAGLSNVAVGIDIGAAAEPRKDIGDRWPWTRAGRAAGAPERPEWIRYTVALAATALSTALMYPLGLRVDLANIVMVYMLVAAAAGLWCGRGPSTVTAVANVLAFDYFFVPPRFSLAVYDPSYLVTFSAMLLLSLVMTRLVIAVREQTDTARARERHTAGLLAMMNDLAVTRDARATAEVAVRRIEEELHCTAAILLCDEDSLIGGQPIGDPGAGEPAGIDAIAAQWAASTRQRVGRGSIAFASEPRCYLPLAGTQGAVGVLVLDISPDIDLRSEQRRLLDGFAGQVAAALERIRLKEAAQAAYLHAESAAMRNTLLASISHDLRTPLSAIASAGSFVAQSEFALDLHRRVTLGRLIEEKARDMSDLLSNVLDLVKLESGVNVVNRDWHVLGDIVGLAIRRNESRLTGWDINIDIPDDLPMVSLDATLFAQLLSNLLENATKYTPPGTRISISAARVDSMMQLIVEDNGPGWGSKDPERLFEKFCRGQVESTAVGVGLGLTVCRAIAHLHGGEIRAASSRDGGARFEIEVPAPMEDVRLEAAAAEA